MPEAVYSTGPGTNEEFDTAPSRFVYQSYVTPRTAYDYDVAKRTRTLLKQQPVLGGYDPAEYDSAMLMAPAKDGTKVPVSLVWKKSLRAGGPQPLLLYGYGSYGYPMDVHFRSSRLSLLDRGMVFAIAHVRGGGDRGRLWYDDGKLAKKMNTFTDFIAAAELLVAKGWTAPDRLVIQGGSAGGLLMGAVANLRPDLFRAVVSEVPFVDVVNTMLDATLPLTTQEYLEWGNPNVEKDYKVIRAYSPYDNLARKAYPAMLVEASLNDSQVPYWEAAKYVAKLRSAQDGLQRACSSRPSSRPATAAPRAATTRSRSSPSPTPSSSTRSGWRVDQPAALRRVRGDLGLDLDRDHLPAGLGGAGGERVLPVPARLGAALRLVPGARPAAALHAPASTCGWRFQGVLMFSVSYVCVYYAEQYVVSGLVAVGYSASPLLNMVGMRLIFGSPMTLRVAVGAALGIVGHHARVLAGVLAPAARTGNVALGAALHGGGGGPLGGLATWSRTATTTPASRSGSRWPGECSTGRSSRWRIALALGRPLAFEATPAYVLSLLYLAVFGSILAFGGFLTLHGARRAPRARATSG